MIIVFDLDGTLANNDHRFHFIAGEKKDWPGYLQACLEDLPIDRLIEICRLFYRVGHSVEIWSGRSDEVREKTEKWLRWYNIQYSILRMRKEKDYREDWKVKEEWLLSLGYKPDIAFDDRQQVVDMWRRNHVLCCQVAPGNF